MSYYKPTSRVWSVRAKDTPSTELRSKPTHIIKTNLVKDGGIPSQYDSIIYLKNLGGRKYKYLGWDRVKIASGKLDLLRKEEIMSKEYLNSLMPNH